MAVIALVGSNILVYNRRNQPSKVRCYWSNEQKIVVITCDLEEDMGHSVTEVKIALPMSTNTLTTVKENVK